ncbi:MAG: response regulator [Acidobacteria bacterium]|nr:response regulator [Acidobacteriota bacterium]
MKERVLVVMPPGDRDELIRSAKEGGFEFETVKNCEEARRLLGSRQDFHAVVTDLTLCDGNWWSVYRTLTAADSPAEIVVAVPRKAANVAEILAHGVFAVLFKPFERDEVLRTLQAAVAAEKSVVTHQAHA